MVHDLNVQRNVPGGLDSTPCRELRHRLEGTDGLPEDLRTGHGHPDRDAELRVRGIHKAVDVGVRIRLKEEEDLLDARGLRWDAPLGLARHDPIEVLYDIRQ